MLLLLLACAGSGDSACPELYADADGDGFGGELGWTSCEAQEGFVEVGGDCDDGDPGVHPEAVEVCNDVDDDCDGEVDQDPDPDTRTTWYADADGDGYGGERTEEACEAPPGFVETGDDCDDTNAARSPDTLWHEDQDGDGYGAPAYTTAACERPGGHVLDASDCDDLDPDVSPAATEVCNGVDDDCDGALDDDDDDVDPTTMWDWYADDDQDGYGDGASVQACAAPDGWVDLDGDCDDALDAVNPGQTEVCSDGLDNDCSGDAPECGFPGDQDVLDADLLLDGATTGDAFGLSVHAQDLDGDGATDLLVGSPYDDTRSGSGGAVHLFWGPVTSGDATDADASWFGGSFYAGWDVDAGDFDGDGTQDLLVGQGYSGAGQAHLVYDLASSSGDQDLDGDATWTSSSSQYLGAAAAHLGDIDDDGIDDLAISAPGDGEVWVHLGGSALSGDQDAGDADVVFVAASDSLPGRYGGALAHGDLDGDGVDDAVVGALADDGYRGQVTVSLGGTGWAAAADHTLTGAASSDYFGQSVRVTGDLDGDGHDDLAVGATYAGTGGEVTLYSGGPSWSGTPWATLAGAGVSDTWGWAVDAGDVTADGAADVVVGAQRWEDGSLGVYSQGASFVFWGPVSAGTWTEGDEDARISPSSALMYQGTHVRVADLDGDGVDDAITSQLGNRGTVSVFLGGSL